MKQSVPPRFEVSRGARLSAVAVLASILLACGGAQTPPPEEPPLLEPEAEGEQAPSSEGVKQATDLIKAEKFAEAVTVLEEEIKKSPEDPQAAFFYGVALEGVARKEDAATSYKRAIELQPKLLEASHNLSALQLDLQDYKGALVTADKGLEQAPDDPGLLINRAYAVDLMSPEGKASPEAILAYEKAMKAAPENLNVKFYYAGAVARSGDKAKALEALGNLPLDGKEIPVVEIVTVYSQLGAFKECSDALTPQIEKGKNVELLIHRSSCFDQAGNKKAAEADLRDAIATDPNSDVAHYYLAKFLDGIGKKAEAKKHLAKANELKKAKGG